MYRPTEPFTTPLYYHTVTKTKTNGVVKKTLGTGVLFNASFKTYGGTELKNNDVLTIEDTAYITTWYNPNITSECIIKTVGGKAYEIVSVPENIDMRNQFMKFKVRAVTGLV